MKKILLPLMTLMLSMVACQKENDGVLTLKMEQYTSDDKLHLDNNYAVWDNGNRVNINGDDYTVSVDNTTHTATITNVAQSDAYTAIFPASWASSNCASITYPAELTYCTNGTIQIIKAPMAAYSENGSTLKFHNLGSILAVNVSGVTKVQKIEVIADGTTLINGTCDISDIATDRPTLGNPSSGTNTITLNCNGVSVPTTGKTFYIALPPVTAKLTIKVYDDSYCYERTQGSSKTYLSNYGYNVPFSTTGLTPEQYAPLSNQIWYTAASQISVNTRTWSPISNDFSDGKGVLTYANDIETIPASTFSGKDFTSLTLPSSVTAIANSAFLNCYFLTSVSMPGVTTIGDDAFLSCAALTSVSMPSVTTIGTGTGIGGPFRNCSSLATITLPACLTSVGGNSFNGCPITNIYCYKTEPIGISTDWGIPVLPAEDQFLHVPEGATGWSDWWFSGNGTVLYDL